MAQSSNTTPNTGARRRSQRVLMKVPVRVGLHAGNAALSEEDTHTLAVSAHGALIAVASGIPVTIVPQREGDKLYSFQRALAQGIDRLTLQQSVWKGEDALREFLR